MQFERLSIDDPLANEVLVRVERVGLCHSDLHYVRGSLSIDLPALLGHEVVGVVERVGGSATRFQTGDRVVATVTPSCGACAQCLAGRPTQCCRVDTLRARPRPKHTAQDGSTVGSLGSVGAFAEAILVSESSLAAVDRSVPAEVACLLGCCITTGVGAVVHSARVTPADIVAVIGCGGVGMSAIQGARLAGARRIIAIDTVPGKLDAAKRFGATDIVLTAPSVDETVAALFQIVPTGVDHAIEAVGRTVTAELAFACLAPTGTATILGLMPEGARLTLPADALVYGDRVIRGAYMGANRFLSDVEMFIDHYRNGRLDLDAMVTRVVNFADINDGLTAMGEPDTVRVVVDMTEASA
ncbi:alcohol dehydrogenase catalytic domain-containing protein [Nocardia jiangxiensis]|uniref:alcohol dehydrogenase catalytic domain-containing protein n=1 Tax=Nocardia jiangxiensis TaxID=282685 RepID=UPI001C3F18E9|nr:alcohol dehydrogenase catalytic domain-containing protein [Nocardia jiangxiensis]